MTRVVVLLSGGMDSMVIAERARQEGALAGCVFIDYGHPAQVQEGWKAFAYCGSRGVPLKVVHVFGLGLGAMGSESGARVVPHRNAVLLSVAANAAAGMGANELRIGAIADDQEDYVDCRPRFIVAMSEALGLRVAAPLIGSRKEAVAAEFSRLGLRLEDSWSCYGPGPEPCGTCPSCIARQRALVERSTD